MSITDELREYADTLSERARYGATIPSPLNLHSGAPIGPTRETEELYAIADRIDAEHISMVDQTRNKAWNEGFDDGYASADDYDALTKHGWVRGPLDADGVLIRFKDKVTVPWSEKVYEVSGFSYQENVHLGTMTILINVHENGEYKALCAADSCRHYKPTTVEDVLTEMCDALNDVRMPLGSGMMSEEIIAKYAAKLQLKEKE